MQPVILLFGQDTIWLQVVMNLEEDKHVVSEGPWLAPVPLSRTTEPLETVLPLTDRTTQSHPFGAAPCCHEQIALVDDSLSKEG